MFDPQTVAVKVFGAIGDIHPHKMLRQEVRTSHRVFSVCFDFVQNVSLLVGSVSA